MIQRDGQDESAPVGQQLLALEQEKQQLLRKLNHVFGNPEKEEALNQELEELETRMRELEEGEQLSLNDVELEFRRVLTREEKQQLWEKEIYECQNDAHFSELVHLLMKERQFADLKKCLEFGASYEEELKLRFVGANTTLWMLYRKTDFFGRSPEKEHYWLERAAQFSYDGEAKFALGIYYGRKGSPEYQPRRALTCFIGAAGQDFPRAYLYAWLMFQELGDEKRAATVLSVGEKAGLKVTEEELRKLLKDGIPEEG